MKKKLLILTVLISILTNSLTAQVVTTFPYEESFETGGADDTGELPTEWTVLSEGTDSPFNLGFIMNSSNPHSGARTVLVPGIPSVSLEEWLISPEIQLVKGEVYTIKLWYRTGANGGAGVGIGLGDQPNANSIKQNIIWEIPSVSNTTYEQVEIDYTHLDDLSKHIGIVVTSFGGGITQNIFDSFSIEQKILSNTKFENDFIQLTPNPANDFFELRLKNTENETNLSIYSSLGKLVKKELKLNINNRVNVSNMASGVYLVRIEDNTGRSLVKKLIID